MTDQTSKERLSHRLLNIAGDLSEIAANPPSEMDSHAMAQIACQLIALAGHVRLGEDINPRRAPETPASQNYHCNICGGDVTFPEGAKPSMSIGPGNKSRAAEKTPRELLASEAASFDKAFAKSPRRIDADPHDDLPVEQS